ncbi:MAG TPA: FAD-dependent oxidoreductase [Alphaproteobacteria bacterium]|nr:FAD-dependent oxidoreductase [Alphaproteobacteria bacterium]
MPPDSLDPVAVPPAADFSSPSLPPGARIAVIGSGMAGLSAAWLLSRRYAVDVYEQADWVGGHSHTVDAPGADGASVPVDTGFIVYNARNYPNLVRLFDHLGVATQPADMSFAVSIDNGALEYGSDMPRGLFAQPRNLLRPRFLTMLRDVARFYRQAPSVLDTLDPALSLGDWLRREGYGAAFARDHLLPMAAAIWSAPARDMMAFPAASLLRFFDNHGLLQMAARPQWRTVTGGSCAYVRRLTAGFCERIHSGRAVVRVSRDSSGATLRMADGETLHYDQAVFACHADQTLALLADADAEERRLLGAFAYQKNRAVLHSDPALMPRRRGAWSSWNYLSARDEGDDAKLSVTYWMNRLQSLPGTRQFFVTLNPAREPDPAATHGEFLYDHPMFDARAMAAQRALGSLQGRRASWFCGSYFGYGFHEDALASGLAVAAGLGVPTPWSDVASLDRLPRQIGASAPAFA